RSASLLAALLLIGGYDPAWSQEKAPRSPAPAVGSGEPAGPPLTPATQAATIEGVLKRLREGYVFPDVAQKMGEGIHERAMKGDYDGITRGKDLARLLTVHLREVSHDSHIVVTYSPAKRPKSPANEPTRDEQAKRKRQAAADNFGFKKVE